MQKSSTMRRTTSKIFKGRQLTIGMDLGDRWSFYCVLEESGRVLLKEAEDANQVAAPTETRTPNWHRAKIAQLRVRMEGWRQRRLG